MKIRPVGAESFRTDGRTDMTKLIVAFLDFANAPKPTKLFISYMNMHVLTVDGSLLRLLLR